MTLVTAETVAATYVINKTTNHTDTTGFSILIHTHTYSLSLSRAHTVFLAQQECARACVCRMLVYDCGLHKRDRKR